jgi:xanthine dehydrogenase accessory factor
MIKGALADRMERLTEARTPFVVATVVRARRPTSVRPGDSAVVLADGTIDGFVGGACAESSVRLYSLRAIETGEAVLLRLVPGEGDGGEADDGEADDGIDGAVVEHNPCLSGGSLEIFLEPQLPAARLAVLGGSPIAGALARVAAAAGYDVASGSPSIDEAVALVVASHGAGEEQVLAEALRAGVPYVGLVASSKRGEAVRESLDIPAELRAQLHTPAGLDLGGSTPEEIAISILAQIVAEHHAHPVTQAVAPAATTAVDPVCGMQVAVSGATASLDVDGERVYFCSGGCRDAYAAGNAAR